MDGLQIRPFGQADLSWAEPVLESEFGGRRQVRRGELLDVLDLPGLVAEVGAPATVRPVGLLAYRQEAAACEIALLWASERRRGVGTGLVQALRDLAAGWPGCQRLWLVTTNDNLDALRFYQRRGFVLAALRPGAVDDTRRRFKPQLPATGDYGIPLRDELELELSLAG
jgi:ribosomal protein S18 acetylase RimI-like enzyme